jgi:hypothetical protein
MLQEVKDATQKLAATAATIPDAQAVAIAEIFGTTIERAQKAIVITGSGILQFIEICCMFFGCSVWSKAPTAHATSGSVGSNGSKSGSDESGSDGRSNPKIGNGGNVMPFRRAANAGDAATANPITANAANPIDVTAANDADCGSINTTVIATADSINADAATRSNKREKPTRCHSLPSLPNGRKVTCKEALVDLKALISERGLLPSQRLLAARWQTPETTISRWVNKWQRQGDIAKRSSGKCNELVCVALANVHAAGTA